MAHAERQPLMVDAAARQPLLGRRAGHARVARALLPLVYGAPATLLLGTPAAQRDADAAAAQAVSDGAAVSRLTREVVASG